MPEHTTLHETATEFDHSRYEHHVDADHDSHEFLKELVDSHHISESDQKVLHEIGERLPVDAHGEPQSVEEHLQHAHEQIVDRLQHNLAVYHDLEKLRNKASDELTKDDLMFVEQAAADTNAFGDRMGAMDFATLSTAAFMTLSLILH